MSSSKLPVVSIGMPLYNEEKYLPQTLDSLLAQDFEDFELIISDNASEDATREICLAYAARDARIRYYRNEVNMGINENFNRVFRLSAGKYFMWASGHDLWAATFISRCVQTLEHEPSVVLSYPLSVVIDVDGSELGLMKDFPIDTRHVGLVLRLVLAICGVGTAYMIYGVIRSGALRATRHFRNVMEPEYVLLTELATLGSFANVAEILFYIRKKWGDETAKEWTRRYFKALAPRNRNRRLWVPYFGWIYEELRAVKRARLDYGRKALLMACVFLGYLSRYRVYLPRNIRLALRAFLSGWLLRFS